MDSKTSFIMGYNFGKRNQAEISNREVESRWDDINVGAFVQGMVDGVVGDRFRLEIALGQGTFTFLPS